MLILRGGEKRRRGKESVYSDTHSTLVYGYRYIS